MSLSHWFSGISFASRRNRLRVKAGRKGWNKQVAYPQYAELLEVRCMLSGTTLVADSSQLATVWGVTEVEGQDVLVEVLLWVQKVKMRTI